MSGTSAGIAGASRAVKLVLATHNAHKVDELRRILGSALDGIELVRYEGPEPVEDGDTFEANALLKARAASAFTGLAAIADDSGISVDALDGAPGIHSARYAGGRDDAANVELLLRNLGAEANRAAHFSCAAALVVPPPVGSVGPDGPADVAQSSEFVELGLWHGSVLLEPVGSGGFGYDPIFMPTGGSASAAEMSADEKNAASHRALAFAALMPTVRAQLLGE
ncbi:RdgB/HAM1 family non-canonical purine NTP pyrophosphatase [Salinibacterium sp.]|uniref:RdgB/HAM1 family non-canonical purine NTP pyrophosphatase n=1 Tax=Salinibacterium sp. TaxID=1915057 RepID=UPI00286A3EEC|nr:RdgB/HAM1 family non-canonical purine NTP pyrophosphatase [Salinibacterium sp.]